MGSNIPPHFHLHARMEMQLLQQGFDQFAPGSSARVDALPTPDGYRCWTPSELSKCVLIACASYLPHNI